MAMADEEHGDPEEISVRLEWPVDPLEATPVDGESDPLARLEARLAALEDRGLPDGGGASEVLAAIEDVSVRLDFLSTELVEVMRQMNDTVNHAIQENTAALDDRVTGLRTAVMSMLASRQTDEQRTQRRDREVLVAKIEEDMRAISRSLTEAIAASRTQSDVFADRVAAELQALRRRIPVKGRDAAIDDRTIEDIVARVSDEVEIRVAAALKPKTVRKKT